MHVAPLLLALALVRHVRKLRRDGFDFDVIDAYYLYPDGVAAVLLGLLFRRPVVLTAFGSDVSLIPEWRLPRAAILWALRRTGHATAVCQALRDRLVELGAERGQVRVILHGVDLQLFHPVADRAALRESLGFNGPTVLSVGHLIPRKGHDVAIRAMARLPKCRLHIVGDGPEEARLRRLACGLGLGGRVTFHGHLPQAALAPLLAAADLLINCSDREGIANVLLEAMACGTPVAATPIWGSPEVVSVPEAGLLLRNRSPEAAAEGVARLLAAPPDRAATRRHAERFSWAATARQHMAILGHAVRSWAWAHPPGRLGDGLARKD
jgi:glycosyltransferase involved in cell wall biosynthesis